jgi:hypothetical protein
MKKRVVWVLVSLAMAAGPVLAQGGRRPEIDWPDGYRVPPLEPSIDWIVILYFVVMCLGTAVIGFMRSNRTHLD